MDTGVVVVKLLIAPILILALAGCGAAEEPITQQQALDRWNETYKSDCYAPRDYGTSIYPTDLAQSSDFSCFRAKALNVRPTGDNEYCFDKVSQSSWKFSDDPGFGISDINRSEVCYSFSRDAGEMYLYFVSSTDAGTLSDWPAGGL